MKRKRVQKIDVTSDKTVVCNSEEHDVSTTEENYEFLDNIDFLKHVDLSDCQREIYSVENDKQQKKDEIKINVDYLDDLAFFDELDYFEQLNKSLEEELKELDGKVAVTALAAKGRWIRRHSDGVMLAIGIGVFILLGTGVIKVAGTRFLHNGDAYAKSKEVAVVQQVDSEPIQEGTIPVVQQRVAEKTAHQSQSMIKKRQDPKAVSNQVVVNDQKKQTIEQFYSDSVFIGNSLVDGLHVAGGVSTAKYLAVKNLNVSDAMTRAFIGGRGKKQTVPEELSGIECKKIFVMLGLNEIGWPYPKVFGERYVKVLEQIKKIKPNATVYVQSILPCSKAVAAQEKEYKKENIDQFNQVIQEAAKTAGCKYIDVGPSVVGSDGYLPSDAAVDGIHLKKAYNEKWAKYLYEKLK